MADKTSSPMPDENSDPLAFLELEPPPTSLFRPEERRGYSRRGAWFLSSALVLTAMILISGVLIWAEILPRRGGTADEAPLAVVNPKPTLNPLAGEGSSPGKDSDKKKELSSPTPPATDPMTPALSPDRSIKVEVSQPEPEAVPTPALRNPMSPAGLAAQARLGKAKADYKNKSDKIERDLVDALKALKDKATAKGDKAVVDQLTFEEGALKQNSMSIPRSLRKEQSQALRRKSILAANELMKAYEVAVQDYTKARENEEAGKIQVELASFRTKAISALMPVYVSPSPVTMPTMANVAPVPVPAVPQILINSRWRFKLFLNGQATNEGRFKIENGRIYHLDMAHQVGVAGMSADGFFLLSFLGHRKLEGDVVAGKEANGFWSGTITWPGGQIHGIELYRE